METGTLSALKLRDYQEVGVQAVWSHLENRSDNPCVEVPTGGGKTPMIARICRDAVREWDGRVIILSHVRELLEQSFKHLKAVDPTLPVGIYSAGLGEKDPNQAITIAGIQSACRRPDLFPPANLIIIDEAHRIPSDGEGQYRTFLDAMKAKNQDVRLIGFTATPYRMGEGMICAQDNLLNHICFKVGIRELIVKGYLTKLRSKGPTEETDFSRLSVVGGEFAADELEDLMSDDFKVGMAVSDLLGMAQDRKSVLIFCCGLKHGAKVALALRQQEESVAEVYGETPSEERDRIIRDFRDGKIRFLVNVNVLSIGFDAPNVDCVALMRATKSPGLYYQAVGRGFRIAPGKTDCLVMDFGGNILRHGPVDDIKPRKAKAKESFGNGEAPVKKCPECHEYVPINQAKCDPPCDYEWPIAKHESKAGEASILSDPNAPEVREVESVEYSVNEKAKEDGVSVTLKVDYVVGDIWPVSEFVCFQHRGYAREKAVAWWRRRANTNPPLTVEEAIERRHELIQPKRITIMREGKYKRITAYQF